MFAFTPVPERRSNLILLPVLLISTINIHLALGQLVELSECVCPGKELRLECTVVGGGSTVWRGTAFDHTCRSDGIVLRHSQFESGVKGFCNNGMITGRNVNRTFDGPNSTYISQLTIQLPLRNDTNNTLEEGKTVECIYDDGRHEMIIGTHMVVHTREAPPPDNVHIAQINKNMLFFQWEHGICLDSIGYKVNATNCGVCPNTTFSPSVTCVVSSVFNAYGNKSITCALSVETTVCGTNTRNTSNTVMAILKAPDPPIIRRVLPYYSASSRELFKIDVEVNSDPTERYNISDGIDGSTTSYTFNVIFLDSDLGCSGLLAVLPISSCVNGICNVTLDLTNLTSLPCYMHPSQAEMAVYASNVLTDGPPSAILLNTSNDVFFVEYEPLSHSFSCRFVGHYENITCEVTYGPVDLTGQTCSLENQVTQINSSDSALIDTVIVHIPSLAQNDHESKMFCFRAVGTTSMFTVGVEGSFTIGSASPNFDTNLSTIAVSLITVLCVIIILILLALIAILSVVLVKKGQHGLQETEHKQLNCHDTLFTQSELRPREHTNQRMIYSEVTPLNVNGTNTLFVLRDDDKVEYAEINHLRNHTSNPMKVLAESNSFETVDDSLTLDSLLIQLRPQVTPIWYKFGLALGISKDTLNSYTGYPNEECIVEVLDHWLRNRKNKPTWRDVAKALKDVGLYQLADGVLNVYKTGKLPVEVDMEAVPQDLLDPQLDTGILQSTRTQDSPPPLPPKYS